MTVASPLALASVSTRRGLRAAAALTAATLALGLTACGGEQGELSQWMEQQKREVKPSVQPLSPPKKFNPQAYGALAGVEPFSTQKLSVALKQEARQPNSLLAAEINRRKEPLEAYPLDRMAMVGSVIKAGRPYALVRSVHSPAASCTISRSDTSVSEILAIFP